MNEDSEHSMQDHAYLCQLNCSLCIGLRTRHFRGGSDMLICFITAIVLVIEPIFRLALTTAATVTTAAAAAAAAAVRGPLALLLTFLVFTPLSFTAALIVTALLALLTSNASLEYTSLAGQLAILEQVQLAQSTAD